MASSDLIGVAKRYEDWEYIRSKLDKNSYKEKDDQGGTLLHVLAEKGRDTEIAQLLQLAPAEFVNLRDSAGRTPLLVACRAGRDKSVQMLLNQAGISLTIKEHGTQRTALHLAAVTGSHNVLKHLLQHVEICSILNARDKQGQTPLTLTCFYGHLQAVKILLNHPATDLNLKDNLGRTALHHAAARGHLKVVQALVQRRTAVTELKQIVTDSDMRTAEPPAESTGIEASLRCPDNQGSTPLDLAKTDQIEHALQLALLRHTSSQERYRQGVLLAGLSLAYGMMFPALLTLSILKVDRLDSVLNSILNTLKSRIVLVALSLFLILCLVLPFVFVFGYMPSATENGPQTAVGVSLATISLLLFLIISVNATAIAKARKVVKFKRIKDASFRVRLNVPNVTALYSLVMDFWQSCSFVMLGRMFPVDSVNGQFLRVSILNWGSSGFYSTFYLTIFAVIIWIIVQGLLASFLLVPRIPRLAAKLPWLGRKFVTEFVRHPYVNFILVNFSGALVGTILSNLMKPLGCTYDSGSGSILLNVSPDIECWEGHHSVTAALGVVGLLAYSTSSLVLDAILYSNEGGRTPGVLLDVQFIKLYDLTMEFFKFVIAVFATVYSFEPYLQLSVCFVVYGLKIVIHSRLTRFMSGVGSHHPIPCTIAAVNEWSLVSYWFVLWAVICGFVVEGTRSLEMTGAAEYLANLLLFAGWGLMLSFHFLRKYSRPASIHPWKNGSSVEATQLVWRNKPRVQTFELVESSKAIAHQKSLSQTNLFNSRSFSALSSVSSSSLTASGSFSALNQSLKAATDSNNGSETAVLRELRRKPQGPLVSSIHIEPQPFNLVTAFNGRSKQKAATNTGRNDKQQTVAQPMQKEASNLTVTAAASPEGLVNLSVVPENNGSNVPESPEHSDRNRLAYTITVGFFDRRVRVYFLEPRASVDNFKMQHELLVKNKVRCVWSRDRGRYVVEGGNTGLCVWNLQVNKTKPSLSLSPNEAVDLMTVSNVASHDMAFTVAPGSDTVSVWKLKTGEKAYSVPLPSAAPLDRLTVTGFFLTAVTANTVLLWGDFRNTAVAPRILLLPALLSEEQSDANGLNGAAPVEEKSSPASTDASPVTSKVNRSDSDRHLNSLPGSVSGSIRLQRQTSSTSNRTPTTGSVDKTVLERSLTASGSFRLGSSRILVRDSSVSFGATASTTGKTRTKSTFASTAEEPVTTVDNNAEQLETASMETSVRGLHKTDHATEITGLYCRGAVIILGLSNSKILVLNRFTGKRLAYLPAVSLGEEIVEHQGPVWTVALAGKHSIGMPSSCEDLDQEGLTDHKLESLLEDMVLLSGSEDRNVMAWEMDTHKCIKTLSSHKHPISDLLVVDDLLFTWNSQSLKVWQYSTAQGSSMSS